MGSLGDRIRRLEEPGGAYPRALVQAALERLTTEELEDCVAKMESVIDGGEPEKVAQPVVLRISRLCEAIKREGSYD